MLKWSFLALGLGWAVSMIYEWMWSGGSLGQFIMWAVVGLTIALGLFVRSTGKEQRAGRPRNLSPMLWFLLAAITAAAFYSALERTAQGLFSHIPMLPLYFILFLDFFASGCYTWWRKRR